MKQKILGISAFYHDSAAAVVVDGRVLAAAQEERFTRRKNDPSFPANAIMAVLNAASIKASDVTTVAFYDKPFLKFERLLETAHDVAPFGFRNFVRSMPVWIREKLFTRQVLRRHLAELDIVPGKILFPEHHLSHAASAFYPSPFAEAAILTIDGVGEWATTAIFSGLDNGITVSKQLDFPHSLGLLYSAFTYYCGFRVNSGEYKLMGLAPFGRTGSDCQGVVNKIYDQIVAVRDDGSFALNLEYFDFVGGTTMTRDNRWLELFGIARRQPGTRIRQEHATLAAAAQVVVEETVIKLADHARATTGQTNLVMAGGVALNCVANGQLLRRRPNEGFWVQPAAGDAGGAVGAALAAHYIYFDAPRAADPQCDGMAGALLGPPIPDSHRLQLADQFDAVGHTIDQFDELCLQVARDITGGKVVGWCQGSMEFGPRALGNRSIVADPTNPTMQKHLNDRVKRREPFRPFAPAILLEHASEYFELSAASPYMLLVGELLEQHRLAEPQMNLDDAHTSHTERPWSTCPAVTHVDFSARVQTVDKNTNPRFRQLLTAFHQLTGIPMLINTSFNVRDEPIVCDHFDAYRSFMTTEIDILVIGDTIYRKQEQPGWQERAPVAAQAFRNGS